MAELGNNRPQEERRHRSRRIRDIFAGFPADQQADLRRDLDRRRTVRRASDRSEADAVVPDGGGAEAPALHDPSRPTVLVIDDVAATRAGLAELLRLRGYNAIEAADGAEGMDRLRSTPAVQVIILDLGMPGFDGGWFRDQQMKDPAHAGVPVIVFTGSTVSPADIERLQVTEVMTKPFSVDRLFERLEQHCATRHRP